MATRIPSSNPPAGGPAIPLAFTRFGYRGPSNGSSWIDKPIRVRMLGG